MNCDDFLEALESPDERLRTAARWHANACPDCAALADVHARLQTELGSVEPLPRRLRAVWEAAAADESPLAGRASEEIALARRASEGRISRHLPMQLVSLAAALLLLFTVALLLRNHPGEMGEKPGIGPEPSTAIVKNIDASAELSNLLAQVKALEAELTQTSKQADLVDARREANVLLATYNHW
jgi:hypothetical protein